MSRKFNAGDRVRVIRSENRSTMHFVGAETTVLGPCDDPFYPGQYYLDLPPSWPATRVAAPPDHLQLIYDGNEKVSWSTCVWQPKKVAA